MWTGGRPTAGGAHKPSIRRRLPQVAPRSDTVDGDQMLAVSTGVSNPAVKLTALGAIAAEVVTNAIVRAVRMATGVPGWPAVREL